MDHERLKNQSNFRLYIIVFFDNDILFLVIKYFSSMWNDTYYLFSNVKTVRNFIFLISEKQFGLLVYSARQGSLFFLTKYRKGNANNDIFLCFAYRKFTLISTRMTEIEYKNKESLQL